MNRLTLSAVVVAAALAMSTTFGCDNDSTPTPNPPAPTGGPTTTSPPAAGGQSPPAAGHPNAVPLGTVQAGGLTLAARQDEPLKAGGEGAFDLKITGYAAGAKPKAVRFWVGVESGEGSVKAKADEETPDNWHTHVEVPNPLPADGKFWAEVEPATGEKFKVSFAVKSN